MSNEYISRPDLDGNSFYQQGNATGFLLIHGFTASTAEVRPLAKRLSELGYTVSAPLLPGHNTHPDDLNKTKWQEWYAAVRQSYLDLRENCDQIWLGGESMGGLLCLMLAAEFPEAAGLLLFAPALYVDHLKRAYLLQIFKKYLPKRGNDQDLDWRGYNVYPLKGAVQLRTLQRKTRRILPRVTQPALIFLSEADQTVEIKTGEVLMDGISSKRKELIVLKKSPHVMLLGQDQDLIINKSIEFVEVTEPGQD